MSDPSKSLVLDLIFPPDECVWQEQADTYVRHGVVEGVIRYESGYVPYLAYGYYQGAGG